MAVPYELKIELGMPVSDNEPAYPVELTNVTGDVENRVQYDLELTGSGYKYLDFGSISHDGAKLIVIKYVSSTEATPPLLLLRPNATGAIYLPVGGTFLLHSPDPSSGIWRFRIDYTGQASLNILLLG